ncbi:tyrosine-protein phosphatase [Streptosporangium sp. NPDC051022]|uniref:tyrosine-protein phosphatase n=1 Tax=Streptosporangium sp. NPDC051022 TaxID=3155752 RepID=UPI0034305BAF
MTRHIEYARLHNFRDVGGYAAEDGLRVRWRRLYRSDSLHRLADDDLGRFHALGVRTVIDLRHPEEIERQGRAPHGPRYHNLSLEHRFWNTEDYDPETGLARFFADHYHEMARESRAEIGEALEVIAEADNAPVVIHCAAGKDRTGVLAALVLRLLGVPEEDVIADYALTGLATPRAIARWRSENPNGPPPWPGYGQAPSDAMRFFLAELGSVRDYCLNTLRVSETLTDTLRRHLLENPDTPANAG